MDIAKNINQIRNKYTLFILENYLYENNYSKYFLELEKKNDDLFLINYQINDAIKEKAENNPNYFPRYFFSEFLETLKKFLESKNIEAKTFLEDFNKNFQNEYFEEYDVIFYNLINMDLLKKYKLIFNIWIELPIFDKNSDLFYYFYSFIHGLCDITQNLENFILSIFLTIQNKNFMDLKYPQLISRFYHIENIHLTDQLQDSIDMLNLNDIFSELETRRMVSAFPVLYHYEKKIEKELYKGYRYVKELFEEIDAFLANNNNKGGIINFADYGMGKSASIILCLDYIEETKLDNTVIPIYIYFHHESKIEDPIQYIHKVINELYLTLLKNAEQIPDTLDNDYENIVAELKDFIKKLNKKIIIFVDEIDILITENTLNLEQKLKFFKFLLDLIDDNIYLILYSIPTNIAFYNYKEFPEKFKEVFWEPLSVKEIKDFLEFTGVTFTESELNIIKTKTNGNYRMIVRYLNEMKKIEYQTDEKKEIKIYKLRSQFYYSDTLITLNDFQIRLLDILIDNFNGKATSHQLLDEVTKIDEYRDKDIKIQKITANLISPKKYGIVSYEENIYDQDSEDEESAPGYIISKNFLETLW